MYTTLLWMSLHNISKCCLSDLIHGVISLPDVILDKIDLYSDIYIVNIAGANDSGLSLSGIVNKTRSWLERSLNQSKSQRCSILWKMYFYLEVSPTFSGNIKNPTIILFATSVPSKARTYKAVHCT